MADPVAHNCYDVVIIGAGAAGLLAATRAAQRGRRTLLLEKNPRPGVKILMSGGTRCNLTHAVDRRGIVEAFGRQGPFLHSALAALPPEELIALVEAEGVKTKVEPGGKVFPVSDRATDVLAALMAICRRSGAELRLNVAVGGILRSTTGGGYMIETPHGAIEAASVVIAVGGRSYPKCGTCGDGYAWAVSLGHRLAPLHPALTPLTSPAMWVKQLSGVTIEDALVRLENKSDAPASPRKRGKALDELSRRGAMLFTHFGLSGPAPMDLSRHVSASGGDDDAAKWMALCDFAPTIPRERLLDRFTAAASETGKRSLAALLADFVPRRLADALLVQSDLPGDRRLAEASRSDRQVLVAALKEQPIPIDGTRGYQKAEVTAGGVLLDEVDSRDMQSQLVPGLYFAGEILDLDGPIGGYNFQAAFSTGWLAGENA